MESAGSVDRLMKLARVIAPADKKVWVDAAQAELCDLPHQKNKTRWIFSCLADAAIWRVEDKISYYYLLIFGIFLTTMITRPPFLMSVGMPFLIIRGLLLPALTIGLLSYAITIYHPRRFLTSAIALGLLYLPYDRIIAVGVLPNFFTGFHDANIRLAKGSPAMLIEFSCLLLFPCLLGSMVGAYCGASLRKKIL